MSDPTTDPEYMTPEQAEAELSKESADTEWREHAAKEAAARLATRVEDNVTSGLIRNPSTGAYATPTVPAPITWGCIQGGCDETVAMQGAYCAVHAPVDIRALGADLMELAELKEIAAAQAERIEELLSALKDAQADQVAVRPARAGVPAEGKLTPEHFADLIGTFKAEGVSHFSLESALHGVPVKLALHFMPKLLKRDE